MVDSKLSGPTPAAKVPDLPPNVRLIIYAAAFGVSVFFLSVVPQFVAVYTVEAVGALCFGQLAYEAIVGHKTSCPGVDPDACAKKTRRIISIALILVAGACAFAMATVTQGIFTGAWALIAAAAHGLRKSEWGNSHAEGRQLFFEFIAVFVVSPLIADGVTPVDTLHERARAMVAPAKGPVALAFVLTALASAFGTSPHFAGLRIDVHEVFRNISISF